MRIHRILHIVEAYLYSFRRLRKIVPLSIILVLISLSAIGQQTQGQSLAGTKYLLYLPPNYDPSLNNSPLLITLMGGGEIGDDLQVFLQNNSNRSPAWLINRGEWPTEYPYVVLTPQLPRDLAIPDKNDQQWPTALLDEVITHITTIYNINENQIHLTGVSLGARGCWDYAAAYPQKVAGMVPMSGTADISAACQLKDIPIWAIHGGNDGLVDPFINSTVQMVEAINNCNGQYQARIDLIPSRGHDIWNDIYPETMGLSIFDWLLNFEKGQTNNSKPYVGLGPNLKLVVPDEFIGLYGFSFDVDGSVVNYNWEVITPLSAEIEVLDNNNIRLFPHEEGIHQIRLTATDDEATSNADTLEIEFFNQIPENLNFMSGLMLQDGESDVDLFSLAPGDNIINLFNLGTDDINIRTVDDGVCNSFRFAVNGYQNIRTENREAVGLLLSKRRNPPEWIVKPGSYTISATPFSQNRGRGTAGISFIRRLLVFNQEPKTYNLTPDSDISLTGNWLDSNTSGNPITFQENFQTFNINDSAYLNNPILASGVVSSIRLKTGSYLTINDSLAIPVSLDSASTLQINHPSFVVFGEVHPESKIIYNTSGSLNILEVGDLAVTSGSVLNFSGDSVKVSNLTLAEGAAIKNNAGNLNITIQSDLMIEGSSNFTPTSPFSILFNTDKKHHLYYLGNTLTFNAIELLGQDTLELLNEPALQLNLSRINLSQNALFAIGQCDIFVNGHNVFSENVQNGKIKLGNQSTLTINATPSQNIFLNLDLAGNTLKNLQFNINGAHKIILSDTLKLYGTLEAENGMITSNGYLQLLATDSMSAYTLNTAGTIEGPVVSEKLILAGRVYRYIGSSTEYYSIEKLQEFIPVTGTFAGASTGPGLGGEPSIFSYASATETWLPFPINNNQELFELGKGYAIFFRNENEIAKIKWQGALFQTDFSYTLSGNATVQNELSGWNLIANPFAAPVLWGQSGWTAAGISNTISIADNTVEGGRFLVWDGAVGDVEFSGILSQNQAYWVRSINENPSLTISESAKVAINNSTTFRKSSRPISGLVISLQQGDLVDRLYYRMNALGSTKYLPELDAVKRFNTYFNLYYLQDNSIPIAIKNLSDNQCFNHKLGVEGVESGNYSLKFNYLPEGLADGNLLLRDQLLDSLILIKDSLQYAFSVHPTDSLAPSARFNLAFEFSLPVPEISMVDQQLVANYANNIQWFRDGALMEGETNAILSPAVSGNYHFQVLTSACQISSNPFSYIITANGLQSTGLHIFPNPITNDALFIHTANGDHTYFEIKLLNTNGQEIFKSDKVYFIKDIADIILPEKISNGLYYLSIRVNNTTFHHKVIIKR
jgi:predicted esterase